MFRCHSRCLGHLHARKGPRNAPDLWFCSRCWSIRWYFRTVALRYSPALQAHLSTHAGRLFRRWSDHRHLGTASGGVTTSAFVFTSLLTIPVFSPMLTYAIAVVVAFAVAFALI